MADEQLSTLETNTCTPKTQIEASYYDESYANSHPITAGDCASLLDPKRVTWVHVEGLKEPAVLGQLADCFHLHPLVLEDILNTEQRPKLEDYGEYLYIVLKSLTFASHDDDEVTVEQISIVLGPHYVLSLAEQDTTLFDSVRTRINPPGTRIRRQGTDYLAYVLMDIIVDGYFTVLERLGEHIDDLEEDLAVRPTREMLHTLHNLKRQMIILRSGIWPLREVVSALARAESPLLQAGTGVYLQDLYDHTIQVIETLDTYRDMLSGMLDIYLSSISNRMNEIMKVLTIISTIFMPLTFIAGVYGMNFRHMPELDWPWGYPVVMGLMLLIGILMVRYFRRKGWL